MTSEKNGTACEMKEYSAMVSVGGPKTLVNKLKRQKKFSNADSLLNSFELEVTFDISILFHFQARVKGCRTKLLMF